MSEFDQEKQAWIAEHGSDHLRQAVRLGYTCQRLYATERAAAEFPGFILDFDQLTMWDSLDSPSPEAVAIDAALRAAGHTSEAVRIYRDHAGKNVADMWNEPGAEAVVISGFDEYVLFRYI